MVKILLIMMVFVFNTLHAENIYEKKCVPCHKDLPTSLEGMFMNYIAAYSGEKSVKTIMSYYLKKPSKNLTVMSELFIDTYGIKDATKLNDDELEKAIDIYWNKFKVSNKLK